MVPDNKEIEFASVEQAFQYIKTYYSKEDEAALVGLRERILATTDGASLRQLGREVPALDRESWDREAPGIMHDLVLESFRANPRAAVELLATGDAIITHEQDGSRWREEFPKILMQVREELWNPEEGQKLPTFDRSNPEDRKKIARNPATSERILNVLAHDSNKYVVASVAMNPRIPESLIRKLKGYCGAVDYELAKNPSTPADILVSFSKDKDAKLRYLAKLNKNFPNNEGRYYIGFIEPRENIIFVFGSNPEGRHGAGAARVAASKFGAVKGVGEGLQGRSYALPTKDLRVTRNHGSRSISEVDIMENIRRMYECAEQNPERRFMVAYTNAPEEKTLNGYTGAEMVAMFVGADGGRIPSNVVFSDAWREEMDRQLASLDTATNHAVEVHAAAGEQADDKKYDELKSAFCRFWDDHLKVTKDFDGFYENMVASFRETQGQAFGKEGYARAERFVSEMERDLELMDYLTRSLNYSASARTQRAYKDKDINIYFSTDEHKELSNLAIRRFNYKPAQSSDVLHFCSVEQAYQYMKTFHSDAPADVLEDYRKKILDAGIYSGTAKKLGSTIPGMRKEEWEAASVEYMRTFVRESFRNNPEAQEALLATSGHRLTHNQDRGRWNKLFPSILMEVRDMLEAEKAELQHSIVFTESTGSYAQRTRENVATPEKNNPQGIRFEESEGGYAKRTYENANAMEVDFTVAFAVDFSTSGEKCTARAAGDSLVTIQVTDCSDDAVRTASSHLADMLSDMGREPVGLNIAGNGIYTFDKHGISQDDVDRFVSKVLAGARERGVNIVSIRSGGQSGADEAGIAAAAALGVPAVVRAPKGYVFRKEDNRDYFGKDAFCERFAAKDVESIRKDVRAFLEGEKAQANSRSAGRSRKVKGFKQSKK